MFQTEGELSAAAFLSIKSCNPCPFNIPHVFTFNQKFYIQQTSKTVKTSFVWHCSSRNKTRLASVSKNGPVKLFQQHLFQLARGETVTPLIFWAKQIDTAAFLSISQRLNAVFQEFCPFLKKSKRGNCVLRPQGKSAMV